MGTDEDGRKAGGKISGDAAPNGKPCRSAFSGSGSASGLSGEKGGGSLKKGESMQMGLLVIINIKCTRPSF